MAIRFRKNPFVFSLCVLCVLCGEIFSSSPSVGSIAPRGGQRGTEVVLSFNGARLGDVREVLLYSPGFSAGKLQVVNDNQIKATIKIAADCQLGEHSMRLRTATGISELRTFWVGALPVVEEKEPNSDFAKPQKIALNVTVHGIIQSEDVDYFLVEAKKGQRLTAEIEGMRLGNTLFDPYVALMDSKRFELVTSDDAPLLGQDAVASIIVPADGMYVIQVRESAYGGNGACAYRLHVGTFPRPQAVVPAGGKRGEEVAVRFLGDAAGEFAQKIKLPAVVSDKFGVFAQDANGISPSPIPFRVSEYGNVLEVEPNNTHPTATKAELPLAFNGVISTPSDVDCFRFTAKKGQTFDVRCWARRLGSPLDPVMTLSYFNGGTLATNDDSNGPDSYFRFTVPQDKEYVLRVTDHLGKGGPTYFYRIEFTPVKPLATVSIPKAVQYSQERQTIAVPRGNRMATLLSVRRENFGGELVLGAQELPAGLTLSAENMAANLDVVPVVFEAAAAAPLGGKLTALTARPVDPKQLVESRFAQRVELVTGQPGQSVYWKRDANRTAVAVTSESPYSIRIVEPKVPLVQNGSMNLKIVAERKAGFTAPITVYPLFNPPGVGSASSVTIAANQTETLLPMNASGNAQVRKWKTAVLGVATVGNGPLWVSSQLATLEIAPPFLTFALERAASEQGKNVEIFCKIQHNKPFLGSAKVHVVGLPTKVTTPDVEITKDTKEIAFKLTVDKTSPPGQHRNIFCQVVVTENGEAILHNAGTTELRIDKPLPPKVAATPKPATPKAKTVQAAKPVEKRLSRLERLRLEQEEREKAAKSTGTPPPPKKPE